MLMLARTTFLRRQQSAVSLSFIGSATGTSTSTGDATITLPGGIAQGDVVVCIQGGGTAGALTTPTGYTDITTASLSSTKLRVSYKVMSSSPDTTIAVPGPGSNNAEAAIAFVFRAVNTSVIEFNQGTGISTNPNPPTITPTVNNSVVIACATSTGLDVAITEPANYSTPVSAQADGVTVDISTSACYRILSGGASIAEDPDAFGSWISGTWAAATIALHPLT